MSAMIFYGKSKPVQTIQEHTNELLTRFFFLKENYASKFTEMTMRDWELLYFAVKYHDVGKYDAIFQNQIRSHITPSPSILPTKSDYKVRHNYISVLALSAETLGLDEDEWKILAQTVGFHHEREQPLNQNHILDIYKKHIIPHRSQIEQELDISIADCDQTKLNCLEINQRIRPSSGQDIFKRYVLIKGLLHRLDHAASALVPIEMAVHLNVYEYTEKFIVRKFKKLNELQQFAKENHDKHIVAIAQTGMGKTEAGLMWLREHKGFFTLPLRVSINAMYTRITDPKEIGFTYSSTERDSIEEATGLLHSTSMDYLDDKLEADDNALEKLYVQSKEYANKLVISTIDQILKFPFYYFGFEKEYSLMASSKVIIDELQAYDPRIAALIVRAMVMIDQIGGSFMIMTATLPDFYWKALQKKMMYSRLPIKFKECIDDSVKRHHIDLSSESIMNDDVLDHILKQGKSAKVLVICNTVKRAQELYIMLTEKIVCGNNQYIKLLHSKFIKKDRIQLEKAILNFANGKEYGIWVTTQLVEASLNIDFDFLHTEMSSLDSQFQRYGRCNRAAQKSIVEPNIFIYTSDVSGVYKGKNSVYHEEIYSYSIELLKTHKKGLLLETMKQKMIKELYCEKRLNSIKSDFKKTFEDTLKGLENRPLYVIQKKEAQDLLRDIQEVQAIPECYMSEPIIKTALEEWASSKDKTIRRKARAKIEDYTVGVSLYIAYKNNKLSEFPLIHGLYYIDADYKENIGLDAQKVTSPLML